MAFEVDKEDVIPGAAAAGAAFDAGEIDARGFEGFEDMVESADFVFDGKGDGSLVIAAGGPGFTCDDEKARDVAGVVFDIAADDGEAVDFSGDFAGDGAGAGFFAHTNGGVDGAGDGDEFGVMEFGAEEPAALREGLGVGIDAGN